MESSVFFSSYFTLNLVFYLSPGLMYTIYINDVYWLMYSIIILLLLSLYYIVNWTLFI